jgi:hypothetical protein
MRNKRGVWWKGNVQLVYAEGRFDDWCIYRIQGRDIRASRDVEYLTSLAAWDEPDVAYERFVDIYERTTGEIDFTVVKLISGFRLPLEQEEVYVTLYMGMVAEEAKTGTRLGKRIKRLGVHQVLLERLEPEMAANFSRGKPWYELAYLCQSKGF